MRFTRWPALRGALAMLMVLTFFVAVVAGIDRLLDDAPYLKKREALCRHYIALLQDSRDLADITRAAAIVRAMECNMTRRMTLPTDPAR